MNYRVALLLKSNMTYLYQCYGQAREDTKVQLCQILIFSNRLPTKYTELLGPILSTLMLFIHGSKWIGQ